MAPKKTVKSKKAPKSKKVVKKGTKKKPSTKKAKGAKKVAPKAVKPKPVLKSVVPKGAYLTKSELLNNLCAESLLEKKQGKALLDALCSIGQTELAKGRKFVVPGMARFVVKKRPATKAREGINPFTKEPCIFAAKPARKVVKAYVVKAFKDM